MKFQGGLGPNFAKNVSLSAIGHDFRKYVKWSKKLKLEKMLPILKMKNKPTVFDIEN